MNILSGISANEKLISFFIHNHDIGTFGFIMTHKEVKKCDTNLTHVRTRVMTQPG